MTVCAMFGCKNRMHKGCGKHFFRFPMKDPERLAKWIESVQRDDWTPSIHSKVCSDHFTEKDYMIRPGAACPYLRMDAVPTPLYPIQRKKKTKKRKYTKKATSDTGEYKEMESENMAQETPRESGVTYSHEEEMEIQSDVQEEERHGKDEQTQQVEEEAYSKHLVVEGPGAGSHVEAQGAGSHVELHESQTELKEVVLQDKTQEEEEEGRIREIQNVEGEREEITQEKQQEEGGKQVAAITVEGQVETLTVAVQGEQQVVEISGANMESDTHNDQQKGQEQVIKGESVATNQPVLRQTEGLGKEQGAQGNQLPDKTIVVNQSSWNDPPRPACKNLADYIPVDHAYSAVTGDKENDIPTPVTDPKVVKLRRKIKTLQKQVMRQGVKIKGLKKTLVDLRKNNIMERDPEQVIAEHCSGLTQVLFTQQLKNGYRRHSVTQYCSLMKEFALNLYYASPKAYKFCRLFLCLPHPVSLRNWKAANEGNLGPSAEGSTHEQHVPGVSVSDEHLLNASMQKVSLHQLSSQEGHLSEASMQEGHLLVAPVQQEHTYVTTVQEGDIAMSIVQEGHLSDAPVQEGNLFLAPAQGGHMLVTPVQEGQMLVTQSQDEHISATPAEEEHILMTQEQEGHVFVAPAQEGHMFLASTQEGHMLVTSSAQEGHMLVTSSAQEGHMLVTSSAQEGHMLVTSSAQEGHMLVTSSAQEGHMLVTSSAQEGHMLVTPLQEGHISLAPAQEGHLTVVSLQEEHLQESFVQE